ncbi:hypothetical protein B0J18DRAFT_421553 [Chaetomium sp. MPI-SDFR-AT-0129]|nr:hypothetical protein B0J18DRAFT_421553 [Chaetomium sp. MPI-SDFR-AT-0129]
MSSTFDGDPRSRPMSQAPRSPPPAAFKTFGQVYQYAETFQNPYPEVICSGGADATTTGGINGNNRTPADPDTRSSLHPGTVGSKDLVMHESVWVEPADPPWYKRYSKWQWIIFILCTAGVTGVVVAILGAMNKFSGDNSSLTDTTTTTSMSISTTSTMTATSTTTMSSTSSTKSTTKPTPPPTTIDCNDDNTFLHPINWVGTDVGSYATDFAQAASAAECCAACLAHDDGGCAGWLFDDTSKFTPCTEIIVTKDFPETRSNPPEMCPLGRAPTAFFHRGMGKGGHEAVAGLGPCAVEGKVQ